MSGTTAKVCDHAPTPDTRFSISSVREGGESHVDVAAIALFFMYLMVRMSTGRKAEKKST